MIPMADEPKRARAIHQLQYKAQELGRPPIKADFDDATRARIKAFPWALAESFGSCGAEKKKKKDDK